jgi:hypothetical protein
MRAFMRDREHDAGLSVAQFGDRNAGRLAQRTLPAFGGHHQLARHRWTAGHLHGGARGLARYRRHGGRMEENMRIVVQPVVQRHAQAARFHHPAECLGPGLPRAEMQVQLGGRATDLAIGDADVADRPGGIGQPAP